MRLLCESFMPKKILLLLFALLSLGALSSAKAEIKFKMQHFDGIFLMMPMFVAIEEGFYKKYGLEIEKVDADSGTVAAAILANGSADAIHHSTSFIMGINARNPPDKAKEVVRYFAAPIYELVGLNETIDSCPDAGKPYPAPLNCLRGKRIGITAIGSDNYTVMKSLLAEVGLTEADVNLLPLGGAVNLVNAMRAKQADYSLNSEPGGTMVIDVLKIGRPLVDINANPLMSNWDGHSVFALSSKIEKNPEAYLALRNAIVDSIAFIQDPANDERTVAAFTKHSPIDPEVVSSMLVRHRAKWNPNIDCAAIENVATWTVKAGQVPEAEKAECATFIWNPAK